MKMIIVYGGGEGGLDDNDWQYFLDKMPIKLSILPK
jgi:hypothetical protein